MGNSLVKVIKDLWEEIIRPYIIPARIAMGQALIQLGSPNIKSLLLRDLLSEISDIEFGLKRKSKSDRIVAVIYILGLGPYQNNQEVLESLRGLLGKENYAVWLEYFGVFIPMLGDPVTEYHTYELTCFSLINLGNLSRLEEILFAQLELINGA